MIKTISTCQDHNREGCPQCSTELHDLREFVKSLNSFAWEEWHGHYSVLDGNLSFNIKDGEGNSVASGKDALEAIENFRKENQ